MLRGPHPAWETSRPLSGSSTLLLERPVSPEDRVPGWLASAVIAVAFASLAAWSWGKWTDVHIDFGPLSSSRAIRP